MPHSEAISPNAIEVINSFVIPAIVVLINSALGSFKVATYWPLKPLLISYLFVFYCQCTNKWM
jgi:hypothetical protein